MARRTPSRRSRVTHRGAPFLAALLLSSSARAQEQPTPCFRWAGQVAIANSPFSTNDPSSSSLWYYASLGGEAMTTSDQTDELWTNALIRINLGQDWPSGTPAISLVQADNGNYSFPPAVALGALWASADGSKLYQYAGQFQDIPDVPPAAQNVFQYSIADNEWSIIKTIGDTVTRPAEGSTTVVPGEGAGGDNLGFYFSGHLDDHTVQNWSNQVARVYLSSLVQFDLGNNEMTNITTFSANASTLTGGVPEVAPVHRADGSLTFVPGLGTDGKGVLVSIGGATSTQYVDNSVLDVYDIGSQGWTKQSTLGDTIGSRVNHCAVRASAKVHGILTHQIFIYGGQKLDQSDRDSAIYVLNIQESSYTWLFVGDNLPGQPAGRAGHQCALQGNQMVVVGGLVASSIICDTPGVYVYNISGSAWQNSYKAGTKYSTPALLANITGGIGTGTSSSGSGSASGGDGSTDPDTSGSSTTGADAANPSSSGTTNSSSGGGGSKSNLGGIIGGVVGGLIGLALLALLALFLLRRRRRQRQMEAAASARDKLEGAPGRSNSGSSDGRIGFPYEKTRAHDSRGYGSASTTSPYSWQRRPDGSVDHSTGTHGGMAASDDVEEETMGMEAAFGSSHLVPRQQLRVTNPED